MKPQYVNNFSKVLNSPRFQMTKLQNSIKTLHCIYIFARTFSGIDTLRNQTEVNLLI